MAENVTQTQTNPEPTVSKAEFDRLASQVSEKERSLETLKQQLLSPEYITFLESQNAPKTRTNITNQAINLSNMSLDQLRALVREEGEAVVKQAIAPFAGRLTEVQATLEANAVRAKYADFNDYAPKVVEILENSDVTIEQAYLMAKGRTGIEKENSPKREESKKTPPVSEKPGNTVPLEGDTITKFKNETEAGMAAWSAIAKKHGLSGDTI
jgi:hypothetical protein